MTDFTPTPEQLRECAENADAARFEYAGDWLRLFAKHLESHAADLEALESASPIGTSLQTNQDGFTVAIFKSSDVPPGTDVYTHPAQPVSVPDGWRIKKIPDGTISLTSPDGEERWCWCSNFSDAQHKFLYRFLDAMLAAAPPAPECAPWPLYTVKPGDTLSSIASSQYAEALGCANAPLVGDDGKVYPGQVLAIPPISIAPEDVRDAGRELFEAARDHLKHCRVGSRTTSDGCMATRRLEKAISRSKAQHDG